MDEMKSKPPHLIKESDWTVKDYYQLDSEDFQYEMHSGSLELRPSPTYIHQRMSTRMERLLGDTCEQDYIILHAPMDVILSDDEIRQPDILLIHNSRKEIITERAIVGPPDLIVEILSPHTAKLDRTVKKQSYARFGVAEYWIADPYNLTIEQYVWVGDGRPYELLHVFGSDDTVTSEKMPCVSFTLKDVVNI